MALLINEDLQKLIPPLKDSEFEQLKENIRVEGFRADEPILVWNNTIIDGHNRKRACDELGIEPVTLDVTEKYGSINDVKVWMINNQLGRRNLIDAWRVKLMDERFDIEKKISEESRKNPFKNKYDFSSGNEGVSSIIEERSEPRDTYNKIAKELKMSEGKLAMARKALRESDNNTKEKLLNGEISINQAYNQLRAEEKKAEVLERSHKEKAKPLPEKKYNIIYADPPWQYFESGHKNQSNHYKTMSMQELKELPVSNLAGNDCLLFMWVTFPILPQAIELMNEWGFTYSTCAFTWVKRTEHNKWFFGNGAWTRANAELCLLGKKGKPVRFNADVSQVVEAKISKHSEKPSEVRDRIVRLAGDLPRIELFARSSAQGWDVWGNEISKFQKV